MASDVWTQAIHDYATPSNLRYVAVMIRAYQGWEDIGGAEMTPEDAEAFAQEIIDAANRAKQGIADRDQFGYPVKKDAP